MKLLSDKEFKEIKETIKMYKEEYKQALEDYYKLNKHYNNLNDLLVKFQSKNQKLRNKLEEKNKIINKAIEYYKEQCDDIVDYNEAIIVKILKGEE